MKNVLDLIKMIGLEPKRVASTKGGEFASACPGCDGRDRFRIWPEEQDGNGLYWCRQCGKWGDSIQFLMDFKGLSFKEACQDLGIQKFKSFSPGPQIMRKPAEKPWEPAAGQDPEILWQEKGQKFVRWTHEQLLCHPEELSWLSKIRGIHMDTVKKFKLGFNPQDFYRYRKTWGIASDEKKKLWIPPGLVIPYIQNDRLQRIRIRKKEEHPRYYIIPGSCTHPMMIGQNRKAWMIVESELDGILLVQETGDLVGILAVGNTTGRPNQEQYRILLQSVHLMIAMDFDGQPGALASQWWLENFTDAIRWPVPQGKDPGEAYQNGINLRNWVLAGLAPAWTLRLSHLNKNKRKKKTNNHEPSRAIEVKKTSYGNADSVQRLYALLKLSGTKIIKTKSRKTIKENPQWEKNHWKESQELSQLVFCNEDCCTYLKRHPDPIITADNFFS